MSFVVRAVVLALVGFWSGSMIAALAQNYPTKPLRMLVGFPPGSSLDSAARIDRLNAEIVKALSMPDVKQSMSGHGLDISPSTPDEFRVFLKSEIAKWGKVVKFSGAKVN